MIVKMMVKDTVHKGILQISIGQIGYRMCGLCTGNHSKPLIVFFHQTPSTSVMFESLMNELASSAICLALDTPGFGGSDTITITHIKSLDTLAHILVESIQLWKSKYQIQSHCLILLGHHTGASVASCVSSYLKSSAMILIAPPSIPKHHLPIFENLTNQIEEEIQEEQMFWKHYQSQFNREILIHTRFVSHPIWQTVVAQRLIKALQLKDQNLSIPLIKREIYLRWSAGWKLPFMYRLVWKDPLLTRIKSYKGNILLVGGVHDQLTSYIQYAQQALKLSDEVNTIYLENAGAYLCETHSIEVSQSIKKIIVH